MLVCLMMQGLSRVLGSTSLASTALGTPYYVAPEITMGQKYDSKADVWSLGVVLYELLTLRRPFDGSALGEIIMKIASGRIPPIDRDQHSPELVALCLRMLTLDVDERPSMRDVLEVPIIRERVQQLIATTMRFTPEDMPQELGVALERHASALAAPMAEAEPDHSDMRAAGSSTRAEAQLAPAPFASPSAVEPERVEPAAAPVVPEVTVEAEVAAAEHAVTEPERVEPAAAAPVVPVVTVAAEVAAAAPVVPADERAAPHPAPASPPAGPGASAAEPHHDDDDDGTE